MSKLGKMLAFSYFALCGLFLFSTDAFAYIDPSALTYLVQIVAGAFIAGGAAVGVFWTKFKRKVKGKDKEEDTRENIDVDDINDEL